MSFELSYSECKAIVEGCDDLREIVEQLNDQPEYIQEMGEIESLDELQAIRHGGCASGAYMPAVTYYTANEIMSKYGDTILTDIEDALGELPELQRGMSWSGMASHYVSLAVELWCIRFTFRGADYR